jgi:hypothetical protein
MEYARGYCSDVAVCEQRESKEPKLVGEVVEKSRFDEADFADVPFSTLPFVVSIPKAAQVQLVLDNPKSFWGPFDSFVLV